MSKIKKSDHFYLIDGSGYIFRAYYALPPLSRKSGGLPTGAVSGFCSMLLNFWRTPEPMIVREKPTHFAVILTQQEKILEMKFTKIIRQTEPRHLRTWHLNLNI